MLYCYRKQQNTSGENMSFEYIFYVAIGLVTVLCIASLILNMTILRHVTKTEKDIGLQYGLVVKIQGLLKNKSATNAVAEHAEMIYQELLENIIPILAALDIMPRNTTEHPLWRSLGGLLDEYAKNPFVMEKLRRAIKLDADIQRKVTNYMSRADNLLSHMNETDPNGILANTFLNGLLGQSLTFFTQAYQLATTEDGTK